MLVKSTKFFLLPCHYLLCYVLPLRYRRPPSVPNFKCIYSYSAVMETWTNVYHDRWRCTVLISKCSSSGLFAFNVSVQSIDWVMGIICESFRNAHLVILPNKSPIPQRSFLSPRFWESLGNLMTLISWLIMAHIQQLMAYLNFYVDFVSKRLRWCQITYYSPVIIPISMSIIFFFTFKSNLIVGYNVCAIIF